MASRRAMVDGSAAASACPRDAAPHPPAPWNSTWCSKFGQLAFPSAGSVLMRGLHCRRLRPMGCPTWSTWAKLLPHGYRRGRAAASLVVQDPVQPWLAPGRSPWPSQSTIIGTTGSMDYNGSCHHTRLCPSVHRRLPTEPQDGMDR